MMNEIMQDPTIENKIWTSDVFKMPFKVRTNGVVRRWNLPMTPSQIQDNSSFHFCVKSITYTRVVPEFYFFPC